MWGLTKNVVSDKKCAGWQKMWWVTKNVAGDQKCSQWPKMAHTVHACQNILLPGDWYTHVGLVCTVPSLSASNNYNDNARNKHAYRYAQSTSLQLCILIRRSHVFIVQVFTQKAYLKKHQLIHAGVKRFDCVVCKKVCVCVCQAWRLRTNGQWELTEASMGSNQLFRWVPFDPFMARRVTPAPHTSNVNTKRSQKK
jgi:hypothetical protein